MDENLRYTAAPQRRDVLLRLVDENGYVSSRQVAEVLDVSDMTIRRDLDHLARTGLVRRVVGGAGRPTGAPFAERSAVSASGKEQIAAACGSFFASGALEPGMVVALDAGTTLERIARFLPPGVTVVTHSIPVMSACAERDDITLIGLGGSFHPQTRSFGGPETRAQLANLRIDLAVVSASALRATGLYCQDATEADTKRAILDAAERAVVVADHTKLLARAPLRVAPWGGVERLITDAGIDDRARAEVGCWNVRTQIGLE